MKRNRDKTPRDIVRQNTECGFSLIEVVVALVIISVALLGLAQLFTFSVLNNARADQISRATFLAQQQIDALRNMTVDELTALISPIDELLDSNGDGSTDFRRISRLENNGTVWEIRIYVYPGAQTGVTASTLMGSPVMYKVRADLGTILSR